MNILNLGSLNIDRVYAVERFVREGETIAAQKMEVFCGGKGLNQSLALARAGARVAHVGAVGPDGSDLRILLEESGVDTRNLLTLNSPSGHAIIQVQPDGHNCIIVSAGANGQVTEAQIDGAIGHFTAGDWLLTQNETSNVGYAIEKAKKAGLRVALNPSPVNEALLSYPLHTVDLFLLNETEGACLAGSPGGGSPDEILSLLAQKYPGAGIVLTLGSAGATCLMEGKRVHRDIYPVKAVDTTAAGDTFCGYFLAALCEDASCEEALRRATAASAIAVSRPGAGPSIPAKSEVEAFLRERRG